MENKLYTSNDFKLRFALECAEAINWELTPDLKKIIFSENFETMYGIRQADYDYYFEGLIENHLKPYREQIYSAIVKYLTGEADTISVEISMYDDKGKKRWLQVRGKFINEERKLIYGVSVDMTKQKNLEQRLAGEINKPPPTYTQQNGLSPEFIEKYGLTNCQVKITEAVLQGKPNKEIAVLLNIKVNTVQVHLQSIYRKTGFPGRYALMMLVGLSN
jgi:PAS domain S-box-containing protein